MKTRQTPEILTCAYCGATKNEITFIIGASREPEWCMVYGTGKITCPECYERAQKEAADKIDAHIAEFNGGQK